MRNSVSSKCIVIDTVFKFTLYVRHIWKNKWFLSNIYNYRVCKRRRTILVSRNLSKMGTLPLHTLYNLYMVQNLKLDSKPRSTISIWSLHMLLTYFTKLYYYCPKLSTETTEMNVTPKESLCNYYFSNVNWNFSYASCIIISTDKYSYGIHCVDFC